MKLLPFSLPIDPLHACYLGAIRKLLECVVASSEKLNRRSQLSAEAAVKVHLKWPSCIYRKFRSLDELTWWKGSQFQNFLYLLPAFATCISRKEFHVLVALGTAFMILEADVITEEEVERASSLIAACHSCMEEVFGRHVLTLNMHLLLHLCDQVRNMGPLWAVSSQTFEGHLFHLTGLKSGVRGFLSNIGERFSLRKHCRGSWAGNRKVRSALNLIFSCFDLFHFIDY